MNSLRKIFNHKTSSVSSPDSIKNNDNVKKKSSRHFHRNNTTKSFDSDLKPQKKTFSWSRKSPSEHILNTPIPDIPPKEQDLRSSRSAGALLENNNRPNQFSSHSNSSSTLLPSSSSTSKMKSPVRLALNTRNPGSKDDLPLVPDTPVTQRKNEADEYIQQAIQFHESNQLEKATYYFRMAADKKSPLGMFLYGIALRHGWGCKVNPELAIKYLQKAAESAIDDLHESVVANPSIARHELVLAIYELGVSFRHGWGVPKNKTTAVRYYEIAAKLGDPDAQNDLAFCYMHGEGVKKDMKKAAKYYRMADAQGAGIMGNSWIYKKKYDED